MILEILLQGVPKQKKKGIEGLILSGGRNPALNCQIGQVFFNILR